MLTHTLTDNSVTVLGDDFVPRTIPRSHPAFEDVAAALKAGDDALVAKLMDLPNAIATFMQGKIQIVERQLFYGDRPINNSLARRILQFMEEGNAELAKPLINFLEKVRENPSRRAVEGLYDWAARSNLPITPEGDILAWKIVNADYTDCHTRTFNNAIGNLVEVERNEVDEDPDQTCSYGLHFCSTEYLPHFGAYGGGRRVLVVKLHPRDVVAFPRDYNISKGRACRYEVLGEVPPKKAKNFFQSVVSDYDLDRRVDNTLDEELEVGRFYRTRDGQVVEITDYLGDDDSYYPYAGSLLGAGSEEEWTEYGNWRTCGGHPLDLIEALPYGFEPADEPESEEPPRKSWFASIFGG